MDIQVSSNFERLLFELLDREGDGDRLADGRARAGRLRPRPGALARLRADFDSARASEDETRAAIAATLRATGRIVCPHTAVGSTPPRAAAATRGPDGGARDRASGQVPRRGRGRDRHPPGLPPRIADLMPRPERVTRVPNDTEAIKDVIGREAVR